MTQMMIADPADRQLKALQTSEQRALLSSRASEFPVVAAITDDRFASAVLRMTHALARERGASPTVLEVAEVALHAGWDAVGAIGPTHDLFGPDFRAQCEHDVRARYRGEGGIPVEWPVEIRAGDVPSSIEACARKLHARLVVMGLHRHGRVARALGDHTAYEVVRASSVPVLALRPGVAALPRRVIVAMDFSAASLRAAHLARELMNENGVLYLAHVRTTLLEDSTEQTEGLRAVQAMGIDATFDRVIAALDAPSGMTVTRITLRGRPAEALKVLADGLQPDLIAIGSQSHRLIDRILLGSVASAIVREGRWSVLVTPPAQRVAQREPDGLGLPPGQTLT